MAQPPRPHVTPTTTSVSTTSLSTTDGVRLSCVDYGGDGPPVLLLHGLAGHAGEWASLAGMLTSHHRVLAYDARGHGAATRCPVDLSRAAHVRDAKTVMDQLVGEETPLTLVGQSLGGLTALLTAAAHPDRVEALVLVEAGPDGPAPELPERIGSWMDSWPVPFASFEAASAFFGGGEVGNAWAAGLARTPDGLHPRVDRDVMVATVAENARRGFWDEWDRVCCPVLVVRGASGSMRAEEAEQMRVRHPDTDVRIVPDASHDVHLDQPAALYTALRAFLGQPPAR
ncbi:alpha/beta hydrolase [Streptomyces sp. AM 4-1-1]|uniref:alpha/beta fold hydrolase n=1 Tax=Streptomyces sp. AM 4-1-1 TaxID=3028710 RepID=UPI0023B90B60|nr:alpha/beta hydrolase [Streptomyces sp. AM 4-1-1]WEH33608.1 alpha/beta hydrolase [Streptomyces sp. AM 4-1-1]